MGRFMDVNHVGLNVNVVKVVDKTTRSGCIKLGVDTDKPIHNVTTNPKVALNKVLNKEVLHVGIDVKSEGAQSFYYFWDGKKDHGVGAKMVDYCSSLETSFVV
nr:hypothetical protein [Tanacetum cinerariifolium]